MPRTRSLHSVKQSSKQSALEHSQQVSRQKHGIQPLVGIIMGSDSDYATMEAAVQVCQQFDVPHEVRVVSAHRTPHDMAEYASTAHTRGLKVIIAGAGGAAHLPGMVASYTPLPVIGVPVQTTALMGLDALLSIVQMPAGVPVATVAIGGAKNAGLLAVQILATHNESLHAKLLAYKQTMMLLSREKNTHIATKHHHLKQSS